VKSPKVRVESLKLLVKTPKLLAENCWLSHQKNTTAWPWLLPCPSARHQLLTHTLTSQVFGQCIEVINPGTMVDVGDLHMVGTIESG